MAIYEVRKKSRHAGGKVPRATKDHASYWPHPKRVEAGSLREAAAKVGNGALELVNAGKGWAVYANSRTAYYVEKKSKTNPKKARTSKTTFRYTWIGGQVFGKAGWSASLYVDGKHIYDGSVQPTKAKARAAVLRESKGLMANPRITKIETARKKAQALANKHGRAVRIVRVLFPGVKPHFIFDNVSTPLGYWHDEREIVYPERSTKKNPSTISVSTQVRKYGPGFRGYVVAKFKGKTLWSDTDGVTYVSRKDAKAAAEWLKKQHDRAANKALGINPKRKLPSIANNPDLPEFRIKTSSGYSYVTAMSLSTTLKKAKDYFLGKYINIGSGDRDKMEKVTSVTQVRGGYGIDPTAETHRPGMATTQILRPIRPRKGPLVRNPAGSGFDVVISRDKNGNKVAKLKTDHGSFSIQTLGNAPETHKFQKGKLKSRDAVVAFGEISQYTRLFGTKRQKDILNKLSRS